MADVLRHRDQRDGRAEVRPLHAGRAAGRRHGRRSSTSRSTATHGLPADGAREHRADHRADATATPTSGFAPLNVKFDVTATDEDDDALTYSWDFDGNGTADSTAEDPTHTYTTAGTYEAKVTVSDGEDDAHAHGDGHRVRRRRSGGAASACSCSPRRRASATTRSRRASPRSGRSVRRTTSRSTPPRTRRVFNDAALAHYDAVVFLSTTGDPLNATQQAAFERYIRGGGGYVGIHAAADTEYDVDLVRQAGGRVLPQPPGRHADRDGARSRTPITTPRRACRTRGSRVDEWYNYQSPEGAVVGGGGTDYSPRGRRPRARRRSTSRPTARTTATRRMTTIRSRGASATTVAARGTRAWATPQASFSEAPFLEHLLGGLEVAAGVVRRRRLRQAGRRTSPPTVDSAAQPGAVTSQPGDPVAFTAHGHRSRRRHAHLRVGLRRRRHRDHQGRDAHLHRRRRLVRQGDGHRRQGRQGQQLLQVTVQPAATTRRRSASAASCRASWRSTSPARRTSACSCPGVTPDYTASLAATATSTATAAELTVRDPSTTATGHLVNGSRRLAQPVQVERRSAGDVRAGAGGPAPARWLTFPAPFSGKHGDDRLQAVDRGHRAAGHRRLRQDADVHALGDHAVVR